MIAHVWYAACDVTIDTYCPLGKGLALGVVDDPIDAVFDAVVDTDCVRLGDGETEEVDVAVSVADAARLLLTLDPEVTDAGGDTEGLVSKDGGEYTLEVSALPHSPSALSPQQRNPPPIISAHV